MLGKVVFVQKFPPEGEGIGVMDPRLKRFCLMLNSTMKFQMLTRTRMLRNKVLSCFQAQIDCILLPF